MPVSCVLSSQYAFGEIRQKSVDRIWKSAVRESGVKSRAALFSFFSSILGLFSAGLFIHPPVFDVWHSLTVLDCCVQSIRWMAHDVVGVLWAGESFPSGERQCQPGDHADGGSSTTDADLHFCQCLRPSAQVIIYVTKHFSKAKDGSLLFQIFLSLLLLYTNLSPANTGEQIFYWVSLVHVVTSLSTGDIQMKYSPDSPRFSLLAV